jgi:hypothetical protein
MVTRMKTEVSQPKPGVKNFRFLQIDSYAKGVKELKVFWNCTLTVRYTVVNHADFDASCQDMCPVLLISHGKVHFFHLTFNSKYSINIIYSSLISRFYPLTLWGRFYKLSL